MMKSGSLRKGLLASLHMASHDLGQSDVDYRDMVRTQTGHGSAGDCTIPQLKRLRDCGQTPLRAVCATNGGRAAGWKGTKISCLTARQSRDLHLIFGAADFIGSLLIAYCKTELGWQPKPRYKKPVPRTADLQPLLDKIEALLADGKLPWAYADGILDRMYGTTVSQAERHQLAACVAALTRRRDKAAKAA